jgi:hypothetical protein
MALELKEGAETEGLPTITLGGKAYFVAPLLLRQKIANMPLVSRALGLARKFVELAAAVDDSRPAPEFSEADFEPLIGFVVNGLRRLYPTVTRDDLLDSDLAPIELINAVPVIIAQSGGRKPGSAAASGELPVGEQTAASDSRTSTGASSPPRSA